MGREHRRSSGSLFPDLFGYRLGGCDKRRFEYICLCRERPSSCTGKLFRGICVFPCWMNTCLLRKRGRYHWHCFCAEHLNIYWSRSRSRTSALASQGGELSWALSSVQPRNTRKETNSLIWDQPFMQSSSKMVLQRGFQLREKDSKIQGILKCMWTYIWAYALSQLLPKEVVDTQDKLAYNISACGELYFPPFFPQLLLCAGFT